MVKQGVGLRSIKSFESVLPADMVQEFHTCGDRLMMRIHGYDQLIGVIVRPKQAEATGVIEVQGFDVSRNFAIKPSESILALEDVILKTFKEE